MCNLTQQFHSQWKELLDPLNNLNLGKLFQSAMWKNHYFNMVIRKSAPSVTVVVLQLLFFLWLLSWVMWSLPCKRPFPQQEFDGGIQGILTRLAIVPVRDEKMLGWSQSTLDSGFDIILNKSKSKMCCRQGKTSLTSQQKLSNLLWSLSS